jgi:hypothetical protein
VRWGETGKFTVVGESLGRKIQDTDNRSGKYPGPGTILEELERKDERQEKEGISRR